MEKLNLTQKQIDEIKATVNEDPEAFIQTLHEIFIDIGTEV